MDPSLHPPRVVVAEAVARALTEDLLPLGDLTSALLDPGARCSAALMARNAGRLAGTACATEAFRQVDPAVAVSWSHDDGDAIAPGAQLGTVEGPLAAVLTAERTALNFLGHLSGIATLTAQFVQAAAGGGPSRIWDTRKTTPGLRLLEKAAVRAGGGRNHRGNLADWILLKDNHLVGLPITEAVRRALDRWPGRTVHVECDRFEQVTEAIEAGAHAVLLDNMSPEEVARCVAEAQRLAGGARRCLVEASGGITLETVATYAATGVDLISVSRITNSAPVLDIGLDIDGEQRPAGLSVQG